MSTYSLDEFAGVLAGAPIKAVREVVAVTNKGSLNVKTDAKRSVLATAPVQNAHAHQAINFDVTSSGSTVIGEIGYDKTDKRGRLGNLLEFGGGGDHSPPHHDLSRALETEAPRFEAALADAAERAVE